MRAIGRVTGRLTGRRAGRADEGMTLVELLVSMSILGIFMAVFTISIMRFSRATVRTVQTSDQTTEARVVLDLLDKQVPSASAINRPVLVGTNWYVEFRTDVGTTDTCTQYVLRTATDELAYRTWPTGTTTTATPSAWRTLGLDFINTTTQVPFVFTPATTTSPRQQLSVALRLQRTGGQLNEVNSSFAARNTTTTTTTNPDANSDGVSDTQVCQDIATVRSP